jgi:zinc protease
MPTPTFKSVTTPATSSVSSVERLNRAPVSKDIVRVSLPSAREVTLDNGLTVVMAQEKRAPLVSVRFEIRGTGPLTAPAANAAIPLTAAMMLRQGTPSRSSRQVAEEFDTHGVSVTVGQSNDAAVMVVQANGLAETFPAWFPIVADIVVNPSFPADELTLMKRRLLSEWQNRRSTPLAVATEVLEQAIYGAELSRTLDANAFSSVTSDQLKAWHAERYVPQNTVLSVAGAVAPADVEKIVRETLGGWVKTGFAEPLPTLPPASGARVFIINRPGSVQTTLMVGTRTVDRAHGDMTPLVVANRVLGGAGTARLFVKLREERGLTFGSFSNINGYKHGGDWRAWVEFTSSRAPEALDAFFAELRRIGTEPVPEQELEDAKRSLAASFALTLEQVSQVASYMAHRRGYGLSNDYWDRFPEKLMSISQADTQRVAATYIDLSKLQIVAVGDAAQLEPLLKPFGEITIVK